SVPRAKTSSRPPPQEVIAGPEPRSPPSPSQSDQPPSYHLCQSALSAPRTITSIRCPPTGGGGGRGDPLVMVADHVPLRGPPPAPRVGRAARPRPPGGATPPARLAERPRQMRRSPALVSPSCPPLPPPWLLPTRRPPHTPLPAGPAPASPEA